MTRNVDCGDLPVKGVTIENTATDNVADNTAGDRHLCVPSLPVFPSYIGHPASTSSLEPGVSCPDLPPPLPAAPTLPRFPAAAPLSPAL